MDPRIVWGDSYGPLIRRDSFLILLRLKIGVAQSGISGTVPGLQVNRLLVRADGFTRRVQLSLCIPEFGISFRIIALQGDGFARRIRRFAVLAVFIRAPGQVVKSSWVVVLVFDPLGIGRQRRLVILRLVIVNVAQAEIGCAIIGLDLNRLLIRRDRFLRPLEFVIGIPQLRVSFGVVFL